MPPVRLFLLLLVLLPVVSLRAQVILSDFNVDAEGWRAYAGADATTTVVYSPAGGLAGTGAILLQEPANGANDYFLAPAKFTGNLSGYYDGTLRFDLKLNPAWDSSAEAALVVLTGTVNGSPLSLGFLPPANQYPNAAGFTTFSLALNPSTAWTLTNTSDFLTSTVATPAQIQGVLGNLTSLRILGDWTNTQDRDLLDNVSLMTIPEPPVWSLLGLAGAAAGLRSVRRRGARAAA